MVAFLGEFFLLVQGLGYLSIMGVIVADEVKDFVKRVIKRRGGK